MVIGLLHRRVGLQRGVLARGDGDLGQLARRGAVQLHVPPRHRGIKLRAGDGADGISNSPISLNCGICCTRVPMRPPE